MTCAEVEILLCDYVDGTLRAAERTALEAHIAGCGACTEMTRDVTAFAGFVERAAMVEPPPELVTRILHQIPSAREQRAAQREAKPSWWRRIFGSWVEGFLQPRYVMGMAMTILSFSMLARFAHIPDRALRPSDLDPVKTWQSVDDRAHRIWDRTMKYYDNLRLVIEIQSRLKEWTDQDAAQSAVVSSKTESSTQKTAPESQREQQ
jgi:hypothetical protein